MRVGSGQTLILLLNGPSAGRKGRYSVGKPKPRFRDLVNTQVTIGGLPDGPEVEPDCPPISLSSASTPAHKASIRDRGSPRSLVPKMTKPGVVV